MSKASRIVGDVLKIFEDGDSKIVHVFGQSPPNTNYPPHAICPSGHFYVYADVTGYATIHSYLKNPKACKKCVWRIRQAMKEPK